MPTQLVNMAFWSDIVTILALLLCVIQLAASLNLPSGITRELYCASCEAVTKELHKQLQSKTPGSVEVRVSDALEDICNTKYYKNHDHSPTHMARACEFLLEQHDEDMEQLLIQNIRMNESQTALDRRICHVLSIACAGQRKPENKKVDPRKTDEYKDFKVDIDANAKYVRPVPESRPQSKDEL